MSDYHINRISQSFEKAVTLLQDNLQYLADNNKVGQKFIQIQNLIIKALIDYQTETESIIEFLNHELTSQGIAFNKEHKNSKEIQCTLEAICIIHGITDFPYWANKGNSYLVHAAVKNYREKSFQIPEQWSNWKGKLKENDLKYINDLLTQRHLKEIECIQEKLNHLKKNARI